LWYLQKFLQYIKYIILFFSNSISMYTLLVLYSPSYTFSHIFPHPTSSNYLGQYMFYLPVPWFCKILKMTFLFIYNSCIVSFWHFHIYMYYNLCWFISSIFHLSTLVPFMVISIGLKILCLFLHREYLDHIHHLNFLLLPSPSRMWLPLSVTGFSKYWCICIRYKFHIWEKTCGFWPSETANFI
jgi:hypothetical protein